MYENYYHFTARPFRLSPDPRFYFSSRSHERALSYLKYGVTQGEGFIVITGDIGTGKTTLVKALLNDLEDDRIHVIQVNNTRLDDNDILRMVASSLNMEYEGISKTGLLCGIESRLNQHAKKGMRVLLIIDEAQNLPIASLEELRMLSNFQTITVPYLQTFLLGQKEFSDTIRSPRLEQLRQRVTASFHLSALAEDEIEPYIIHRLKRVGWNGMPTFTTDIFAAIFDITGGIPRRINSLCDRLLLFGCLETLETFDHDTLNTVVAELEGEVTNPSAMQAERLATSTDMAHASELESVLRQRVESLEERMALLEDAIRLTQARKPRDRP